MLSEEQAEQVRKQLFKQIESWPEEKREEAEEQIEAMSNEELEQFIKENMENQEQQCIFCSITEGKISSFKIGESQDSVAILEINPASKGHSLIIPRSHSSKPDKKLAEQVIKKLKKLKPKKIDIIPGNLQGHEILNVLPIYNQESLSKREKASQESLKGLQEKLNKVKEKKPRLKKEKPIPLEKLPKAPKRIP